MSNRITRYEAVEYIVQKGHEVIKGAPKPEKRKAPSQSRAADTALMLLNRPGYFLYRNGYGSKWRVTNGTGLKSGLDVHERYVNKWIGLGMFQDAGSRLGKDVLTLSAEWRYGL